VIALEDYCAQCPRGRVIRGNREEPDEWTCPEEDSVYCKTLEDALGRAIEAGGMEVSGGLLVITELARHLETENPWNDGIRGVPWDERPYWYLPLEEGRVPEGYASLRDIYKTYFQ
jgi:hypothetical protein